MTLPLTLPLFLTHLCFRADLSISGSLSGIKQLLCIVGETTFLLHPSIYPQNI